MITLSDMKAMDEYSIVGMDMALDATYAALSREREEENEDHTAKPED